MLGLSLVEDPRMGFNVGVKNRATVRWGRLKAELKTYM